MKYMGVSWDGFIFQRSSKAIHGCIMHYQASIATRSILGLVHVKCIFPSPVISHAGRFLATDGLLVNFFPKINLE